MSNRLSFFICQSKSDSIFPSIISTIILLKEKLNLFMALTGETVLYPLAVGNKWTYKVTMGNNYTNSVVGVDAGNPNLFIMHNSATNANSYMRKDGDIYYTNAFDTNVFHPYLKDDFKVGMNWAVQYTANGIVTDTTMTVTQVGISKEVEGKIYHDVTVVKGDSKFTMNGSPVPMSYTSEFFYARGVGLILATTSNGSYHSLIDYVLN